MIKTIREESEKVLFCAPNGIITISKDTIKELTATENPEQDIEYLKKIGKEHDPDQIREHFNDCREVFNQIKRFEATGDKNTETPMAKGKKSRDIWDYGRISLSGNFIGTAGALQDVIKYGFGITASFDYGLDSILKKRHMAVPGLRLDFMYFYIFHKKSLIMGPIVSAGALWALPSMNNWWGNCVAGVLFGVAYLNIDKVQIVKNDIFIFSESTYKRRSPAFSFQPMIGYQYNFGLVTLFIHARYMLTHNDYITFHTFAAEAGVGINL